MTVKEITTLAEFRDIINNGRVSVFDFSAVWCGPCRMISPIFEALSDKVTEIDYYKVDVDASPDISQEVNIRAMPSFIAFKNGEKIRDLLGANPPYLEMLIQEAKSQA